METRKSSSFVLLSVILKNILLLIFHDINTHRNFATFCYAELLENDFNIHNFFSQWWVINRGNREESLNLCVTSLFAVKIKKFT
jgi:hypothetical protein